MAEVPVILENAQVYIYKPVCRESLGNSSDWHAPNNAWNTINNNKKEKVKCNIKM